MRILIQPGPNAPENIQLQPSKYFDRLARELVNQGHEVWINKEGGLSVQYFTEATRSESMSAEQQAGQFEEGQAFGVKSQAVKRDFDFAIISIGPTDFLQRKEVRVEGARSIGVVTYPMYDLFEVLRIGPQFLFRYWYLAGSFVVERLLRQRSSNWLFRNLDVIVTESKSNAEKIRRLSLQTGIPLDHIPPAVEQSWIDCGRKAADKRVKNRFIYMGSAMPLRGADVLVEAFRRIQVSASDAELRLLLRPDDKHSRRIAENFKRELEDQRRVFVQTRHLSQEERANELAHADVAVFPFRLVPSEMPVGPLEAKACGCRIIVPDIDGLGEFVGPRDILIDKCRVQDLEEAMRKMTREKPNVRPIEPIRTWDKVASEFVEIMRGSSLEK